MAPFDVPHLTHDMILRFMGVNFSAIVGGSAQIPSSIGGTAKPHFLEDLPTTAAPPAPDTSKSPEQAKAMWEGALLLSSPLQRHNSRRHPQRTTTQAQRRSC